MNMAELMSSVRNDPRKGTWNQYRAISAQTIELDVGGISLDDSLSVADEDVGGVIVGGVDERLHLGGAAVMQALGEIPGDHDAHLGVAVVESACEHRVVVDHSHDFEIVTGLE